jgi:hypothetical protein
MAVWKIVETDGATGAETFEEMENFDSAMMSVLGRLNTPSDRVVRIEGPGGEKFQRWWIERRYSQENSAALQSRELYRSAPNGDRWSLVRESGSGRVLVEHQPNPSSGGKASRVEVGDFLAGGGHGPEHQALLRLIGTLVDEVPPAQS